MSEFLASKLDRLRTTERECLAAIVSFEEWMAEIVLIDHEATSDLKQIAEMLRDDSSLNFKRQRLDDPVVLAASLPPLRTSQVPNIPTQAYRGTGANAVRPSSFAPASQQTSTCKRCLPLTQDEIVLLN